MLYARNDSVHLRLGLQTQNKLVTKSWYDTKTIITTTEFLSTCLPLSESLPNNALGPVGGLLAGTAMVLGPATGTLICPFTMGFGFTPLDGPVGTTLYIPLVRDRGPVGGAFFVGEVGADDDGCEVVDVDGGLDIPVGCEPSKALGPRGGAFPDIAGPSFERRGA